MVDVLTTTTGVLPSTNEPHIEVSAATHNMQPRRQRIARLREAIEAGEYRISAADLADALLRALRRAN